jgi:hypothetical protein
MHSKFTLEQILFPDKHKMTRGVVQRRKPPSAHSPRSWLRKMHRGHLVYPANEPVQLNAASPSPWRLWNTRSGLTVTQLPCADLLCARALGCLFLLTLFVLLRLCTCFDSPCTAFCKSYDAASTGRTFNLFRFFPNFPISALFAVYLFPVIRNAPL